VEEQSAVRAVPKTGDLLVSRRSARADAYEISVVSQSLHTIAKSHREALDKANGLAGLLAVDAWFTCDHRHYASIVRHRRTPSARSIAALSQDLPVRVLDGSPDAMLICDRSGTVRYWNGAAERVFGFGATEALGHSMNLVIPDRLRARHWAAWEATMGTGVSRYGEGHLLAVPALHKSGRQISIEFSIQLIAGAAGQIDWVVAIIRDVTARYMREKTLRAKLKELEGKNVSP
jgi:PAS domain S-box-containing protein